MLNPHLSSTPHLILGGAKSGKSVHAEKLMSRLSPPYIYVATAQAFDDEMKERIQRHRERRGANWQTIETPTDLVPTLVSIQGLSMPALVDCITIWLTNVFLKTSNLTALQAIDDLCTLISKADYPLFLVSNELGYGIVPENPLARQFRDLAGIANQKLAEVCRGVTLVAAGLPLVLK